MFDSELEFLNMSFRAFRLANILSYAMEMYFFTVTTGTKFLIDRTTSSIIILILQNNIFNRIFNKS